MGYNNNNVSIDETTKKSKFIYIIIDIQKN